MDSVKRKVIYCPKTEDHVRPKILLLVSDDKLTIHCHDHEFIDVQLIKGGELMDFSNVSVKLTDVRKGTHFELEEIPTLSVGEFKTKKKRHYAKHNS